MLVREKRVHNSRLAEGAYYDFRIIKTLNPDTEKPLLVLEDPMGYKVMMPGEYYQHYGFIEGNMIRCRVDKINCNGRMFLEPKHPNYKEGEEYEFELVDRGLHESFTGDTEPFILVKDVFQQKWIVRVFSEEYILNKSGYITCRLERIKKGKLFLSIAGAISAHAHLKTGGEYSFSIVGERKNPADNLVYYVLVDQFGKKHPMRKNYYTHYGLKKGQQISCTVYHFTIDGYLFLEPRNPWYKKDETYRFDIVEANRLIFSDGTHQHVLILADPYGEDIKVFIEDEKLKTLEDKNQVNCRVKRIYKSRLDLEVI